MDVYLTEDEQIEKIKQLWNKYGNSLLTALLIVAVVIFAYHWWQERKIGISTQASELYMHLSGKPDKQQNGEAFGKSPNYFIADTLWKKYPDSPYAWDASLLLAKMAVSDKKYDTAIENLKWVETNSKDIRMKQIARLRIAHILYSLNKDQAALQELKVVDDPTFKPLIESLRGDIYQAQNDYKKASAAYKEALLNLPKETLTHIVVQMKLENLHHNSSAKSNGAAA